MTNNPLARRQAFEAAPQIDRSPNGSYAEDLAASYNANRRRLDIEWYVDSNGNVRPRDVQAFITWNTREIERRHESERRQWMLAHRDAEPMREAAE